MVPTAPIGAEEEGQAVRSSVQVAPSNQNAKSPEAKPRRSSRRSSSRRQSKGSSRGRTGETKPRRYNTLRVWIPLVVLGFLALFAAGWPPGAFQAGLVVASMGLLVSRPITSIPIRILWWVGCVALGWVLVTAIPLPAANLGGSRLQYHSLARRKSEELARIYPNPELAAAVGKRQIPRTDAKSSRDDDVPGTPRQVTGSLSLNRIGTVRFALLGAGGWVMMWLSAGMSGRQRRRFLSLLLVGGSGIALVAVLKNLLWGDVRAVWWFLELPQSRDGAIDPFLNPNHFGAFCLLLTPVGLSLVLDPDLGVFSHGSVRQSSSSHLPADSAQSDSDERAARRVVRLRALFGTCLLVLVGCTVLSGSRGACLSMVVGLAVTTVFWLRAHPILATLATLFTTTVVLFFLLAPMPRLRDEVQSLSNLDRAMEFRTEMRRAALNQWSAYRLFGAGGDSYRTLNGIHRRRDIMAPLYAENEYAQFLAEFGVWGMLLVLGVGTCYLRAVHSGMEGRQSRHSVLSLLTANSGWEKRSHSRRHTISRPMVACAAGALAGILLHSFVDFPCRQPLNAFLLGSLVGVALPLQDRSRSTRQEYWGKRFGAFAAVVVLFVWFWRDRSLYMDRPNELERASLPELVRVLRSCPTYWVVWSQLGRRVHAVARGLQEEQAHGGLTPPEEGGPDPSQLYDFSMSCADVWAEYNPYDPGIWTWLARTRYKVGGETVSDAVDEAYGKAATLAPDDVEIWTEWLERVLDSDLTPEAGKIAEKADTEASSAVAEAVWKRLREHHLTRGNMRAAYDAACALTKVAPQESEYWVARAQVETELGLLEDACAALNRAVKLKPGQAITWLKLAEAEYHCGRRAAGNRALSKVKELAPSLSSQADALWERYQN